MPNPKHKESEGQNQQEHEFGRRGRGDTIELLDIIRNHHVKIIKILLLLVLILIFIHLFFPSFIDETKIYEYKTIITIEPGASISELYILDNYATGVSYIEFVFVRDELHIQDIISFSTILIKWDNNDCTSLDVFREPVLCYWDESALQFENKRLLRGVDINEIERNYFDISDIRSAKDCRITVTFKKFLPKNYKEIEIKRFISFSYFDPEMNFLSFITIPSGETIIESKFGEEEINVEGCFPNKLNVSGVDIKNEKFFEKSVSSFDIHYKTVPSQRAIFYYNLATGTKLNADAQVNYNVVLTPNYSLIGYEHTRTGIFIAIIIFLIQLLFQEEISKILRRR